ncbi:hypothetical protein [Pseudohoeflea coraliihabitans]|uniref:Uncharacterized protein n=1 Tax=Pseudohoeflea coraliihabitans TaxID=2860393 RepID=A0ABS6WQP9_9HYPH|nr:hypothetical protein [Pseudohoeflea sp. DP4N28-3]MBW3098245.1 hypothetical protein [Pseudohoeflea sp. DP4N28-3]
MIEALGLMTALVALAFSGLTVAALRNQMMPAEYLPHQQGENEPHDEAARRAR